MNFRKYLAESEKVYNFRIKTVAPLTSDAMGQIEKYLQKFRLISISEPKKTIRQKQPMDFTDIANSEVTIIDISTSLPCSSYIMQQDIRNILNVPEKYIVVRGENEPIELESTKIVQNRELADDANKEGLIKTSLLGTDSEYPDAEHTADGDNYYGDAYNNRLLAYLASIKDENQPLKIDAPNPLFSWLSVPKEQQPTQPDENFNAQLTNSSVKPLDSKAKYPAPNGNFDNELDTSTRTYKTKKGDTVTRTTKPNNIRKG